MNTRSLVKRADGQRRHEFLGRGFVMTTRTLDAPLAQAADEIQALVGGDAAADDQSYAFAVQGRCPGLELQLRPVP